MRVKIIGKIFNGASGEVLYVCTDGQFPTYKLRLEDGLEVFMLHEELEFIGEDNEN